MFESARIRLTAWYLLIIMSVSILFSLVIYTGVNDELQHFEERQERIQRQIDRTFPYLPEDRRPQVDFEPIKAARARLITSLVLINIIILAGSGIAGYFLAGRTLRPIKDMVDQLNRFVSDASHELRTPITSLRSEMEVGLRNKHMTLLQAKKLIESNLEEVIHLQELSENLLTLTQYEQQQARNAFTTVSLQETVHDAVKSVQGQAKKKQLTIHNSVDKTAVFGSADRLRELFTILLDNAVKYSNAKSTVTIASKVTSRTVAVSVSDEGIGISKKEIGHIFERFYRSDASRSKEINGFGLGLSIAKKIVDLHKGSIRVSSTVGQGTTFTVSLPAGKSS